MSYDPDHSIFYGKGLPGVGSKGISGLHVGPGKTGIITPIELKKLEFQAMRDKRDAEYRKAQYEKEWETLVPDSSKIVPLTTGHLECYNTDCGPDIYWCKHIEQFVKDSRDSKYILEDLRSYDPANGPFRLEVPIVPTMGQWATVELGEEHFGNYKVWVFTKPATQKDSFEAEFLGFLSPGEGRKTLRDMILDWFLPRLVESKQCRVSIHSFQAQIDWESQVQNGNPSQKAYLAQCWSVFTTGACLRCAATNAISASDLVPDVTDTKRSWNL